MSSYSRKVPSNLTSEKSLLGAILIQPSTMNLVVNRLVPDDFYAPKHVEIWRSMLDLFEKGRPIDITTLAAYMTHEDASSSYLAGLMADTPGTTNALHYAEDIKKASRRRAVINAAARISASAYEENDPEMAESKAKEILLEAISNVDSDSLLSPAAMGHLLKEYFVAKAHSDSLALVPTGYPTLDNYLGGGMRRGDLITLAARTSVGKSSLAENIAENVARNGGVVLFVTIEMSPEQMLHRYAVRNGGLSSSQVEFGVADEKDEDLLDLAHKRSELPLFLLNSPSATTTSIRSAISRLQMQSRTSLVVVDYLQLLKDRKREEERLNIGEITSTLKMIAREFNVPVLLLSQLNRQIEHRGGEPQLSDLRESGRIEEDSDVVILLWRVDDADAMGNRIRGKVEKNRQGATGEIPFKFNPPVFTFWGG